LDGAGNLYIADQSNRRIRLVMAGPPGVTARLTTMPDTLLEGEGLVLDASASSSPNGSLQTYEFDLDHDGQYDIPSVAPVLELDWSELQGFGLDQIGRHISGVRVTDSTGAGGLAFAEWTVVEASSETPLSSSSEPVTVVPADLTTGEVVAEISFEEVTGAGLTTVETIPVGDGAVLPEQGSGFVLGSDTYVDISTTAEFEGLITICLTYDDTVDEAYLELAHLVESGKALVDGFTCSFPGGCWETVTSPGYPDTENNVICGQVASLSAFALVTTLSATATDEPVPIGATVFAHSTVPDSVIFNSGLWVWGDGSTSDADFDTEGRVLSGEHIYETTGVFSVTLELIDGGRAVGRAVTGYVVVYDPSAGFVTGGGWIDSPEGAYVAQPELTGKASFGFVSKYQKGATVPAGTTEFRFQAGSLDFRSTQYDWLVIAGARAQFKGAGLINGQGNYGFMLTAVDEALTPSTDVDLFRIKIWDKDAADAVVYDNGLGEADDSDPTTPIGGGSIIIHKTKTK
jgi:hypothetical protein